MTNALYQELDRLRAENARYRDAVLRMERQAYYTDDLDYRYCRYCGCVQTHAEPTHRDSCPVMVAVAMAHREMREPRGEVAAQAGH